MQSPDDQSTIEFSKAAAIMNCELLLRANSSAQEVLLVATFMAEFALVQLTDPRQSERRIEWVNRLRARLQKSAVRNTSAITPEEIIAHQKERLSDPNRPSFNDPGNPYKIIS
jgi:hypothetical protein